MDQELQKYYEDRFSMMLTSGWVDFVEDVQAMLDAYNQVDGINSPDEFWKRKGQVDILQWILSLKQTSEQTYKELQDEEAV